MRLNIGNSVTSIGDDAFDCCFGLTSVNIGNSVTSIGDYAFEGCSGLTSVNIPNSVTHIGDGAFAGCSGLTSVNIGNSVTSIGDDAFYRCTGLTSVNIGNSVSSIGIGAFYECPSLSTISIGSGIETIGPLAFASCPNLLEVYCNATKVPRTDRSCFQGSYIEYATLYVPEASLSSFKSSLPWSGFNKIIAIEKNALLDASKLAYLKVIVQGTEIRIENINEPSDVYVYTADGKLVQSFASALGSVSLSMLSEHLYIVKVGYHTFKIAL